MTSNQSMMWVDPFTWEVAEYERQVWLLPACPEHMSCILDPCQIFWAAADMGANPDLFAWTLWTSKNIFGKQIKI